jgi:sulfur transfer complex TusBCD TusB component (DsrH family)
MEGTVMLLFVLFRMDNEGTVFRIAEAMGRNGEEIIFLLTGESCHHIFEEKFLEAKRFVKSIFILEDGSSLLDPNDIVSDMVEVIDYNKWVKLLENCKKVVSWN